MNIITSRSLHLGLYLFVNSLFIAKYFSRVTSYSWLVILAYCSVIISGIYIYDLVVRRNSYQRLLKPATYILLAIMTTGIGTLLIKIDPYSVNVDRWSAVSFFLDHLFKGQYPYAAHTHLCETNFPSPFPVWYLINLPFYLMKDVGLNLIFFLLGTAVLLYYFFESYKSLLLFVLLLAISPAYWWEVSVRSDSLSNALLVFGFILWTTKRHHTLQSNTLLNAIGTGLIAATRLSAVLPLAIYYFRDFWEASWKKKTLFIAVSFAVVAVAFLPFFFWGGNATAFLSRNPFMSQTSVGNRYILLFMIAMGILFSYYWKNYKELLALLSLFVFLFILLSEIALIISRNAYGTIFEDRVIDISYFTLCFPYCLALIVSKYAVVGKN
ncbi:hypothetical protein [Parabacteroides sp. FAFU027]|uniref:hypothetical protein n=1 Tax=Parabacteroides sp. FAFU027 TaxID=2922715 RepID=UPI001FAF2DCC|nr:hypothetical protein [Parabacteroides sp. FAFU027]